MRKSDLARLVAVLLFGATLLLAVGCGYKNAPIPPESVVPEPITDLSYQVDDLGVRLAWSFPVKTIRGRALEDISSFELHRAEVALVDYCEGCPVPYVKPLVLPGGATRDGELRRTTSYQYTMLRPGYKYFFKVRSRTSWWADSDDSNLVIFTWFQPALAPEGLTATPGDSQVSLQWQPVTALRDGSAIDAAMKYQVLRSEDGSNFALLGEPVAATGYVDRKAQNGVKYFYAVQSMMVLHDELINGGTSPVLAASPLDQTPPEPPTGIGVVVTDVGIKIFWDRSEASDIGGYRIYRRAAGDKDFTLVGEIGPEFTLFDDTKAAAGVRYYYAVTAIDLGVPANESRKSQEATFRYQ